jgi:SET domain-containing protein
MPKAKRKVKRVPHYGVYVRLAPSRIHGVGVVAIRSIPKGTHIFYGDDDNLIWIDKATSRRQRKEIRRLYRDFCVSRGQRYGCPRSFNQLTPAWYLNHSKTPNVGADEKYRFYALRNIRKGEELTADYSTYGDVSVKLFR